MASQGIGERLITVTKSAEQSSGRRADHSFHMHAELSGGERRVRGRDNRRHHRKRIGERRWAVRLERFPVRVSQRELGRAGLPALLELTKQKLLTRAPPHRVDLFARWKDESRKEWRRISDTRRRACEANPRLFVECLGQRHLAALIPTREFFSELL